MLRPDRIACLLLVAISLLGTAAAQFDLRLERKLFQAANQERTKLGLPELKWSDALMRAARTHAEKMVAEKKLTHRAARETDLMRRIAVTQLRFDYAAENIAFATESEDIHPGWMHSPGHRANILSTTPNALGVGVVKIANGYYAVQDFARITSADPPDAAELRFAKAFAAARAEKRKFPVKILQPASVRAYACEMAKNDQVSLKAFPIAPGFRAAVGYTTSEPEDLPEQLKPLASDSTLTQIQLGSCSGATANFPGGVYWFIVVY